MNELKEVMTSRGILKYSGDFKLLDEYIEKEKQQIIDAYDSGANQITDINEGNKPRHNTAEQYYNEIYEKRLI